MALLAVSYKFKTGSRAKEDVTGNVSSAVGKVENMK